MSLNPQVSPFLRRFSPPRPFPLFASSHSHLPTANMHACMQAHSKRHGEPAQTRTPHTSHTPSRILMSSRTPCPSGCSSTRFQIRRCKPRVSICRPSTRAKNTQVCRSCTCSTRVFRTGRDDEHHDVGGLHCVEDRVDAPRRLQQRQPRLGAHHRRPAIA
eukprot:5089830-Pleurochrysis_carterae.AAC.2